jgi:hypothetical protein
VGENLCSLGRATVTVPLTLVVMYQADDMHTETAVVFSFLFSQLDTVHHIPMILPFRLS